MKGLLGELFAPYQRELTVPLSIEGEDVAIDDRSATPLALLFHELATNATKYGALSTLDGRVQVGIAREGDAARIDWVERGGPVIAPQEQAGGFGSQLIEMSAVRQLGGSVTRDWRPEGLAMTIHLPLASLSR